jgi:hypothetical protein
MNFFELFRELRHERVLVTTLGADECRTRIKSQLSPDPMGIRATYRRFVGEMEGDRFCFNHKFFAPLTLAELSGRPLEGRGETIIPCRVGLSLRNYIGTCFFVGVSAWVTLNIVSAALTFEVSGADVVIIALQLLFLCALGIGFPLLLRRDVRKNGQPLFESLRDLLDATEATPAQPKPATS